MRIHSNSTRSAVATTSGRKNNNSPRHHHTLLWVGGRHPLNRILLAGVIGCFYLTYTGTNRIESQQQQQHSQTPYQFTTTTTSLESFLQLSSSNSNKATTSKREHDASRARARRISTTTTAIKVSVKDTSKSEGSSSTPGSTTRESNRSSHTLPADNDHASEPLVASFPGYPLTRQTLLETGAQMGRSVVSKWVATQRNNNPDAWCHPRPTDVRSSFMVPNVNTTRRGLFFVKTPKTASQSINRILRRVALRVGKRQHFFAAGTTTKQQQQPCFSRGHHLQGFTASTWYSQRSPRHSVLLTSIRDPAPRALSRIYWTMSTRYQQQYQQRNQGKKHFDTVGFLEKALQAWTDVETGCISEGKGGFQLSYVSLQSITENAFWSQDQPTEVQNPTQIHALVQQILNDYDLILVQERLEESLVAMQLLLGIETTDILSMPLHVGGSYLYDRHAGCLELFSPPKLSFLQEGGSSRQQVSSDKATTTTSYDNQEGNDNDDDTKVSRFLEEYLQSPTWYAQNYGDYVLLGAAQAALDQTIQELGMDRFQKALEQFRTMQKDVIETCSKQVVFPCSPNGTIQRDDYQLGNPKGSGDRYPQKDIEACINEVIRQHEQQEQGTEPIDSS